jgi:hypothetical protein
MQAFDAIHLNLADATRRRGDVLRQIYRQSSQILRQVMPDDSKQ